MDRVKTRFRFRRKLAHWIILDSECHWASFNSNSDSFWDVVSEFPGSSSAMLSFISDNTTNGCPRFKAKRVLWYVFFKNWLAQRRAHLHPNFQICVGVGEIINYPIPFHCSVWRNRLDEIISIKFWVCVCVCDKSCLKIWIPSHWTPVLAKTIENW